MKFSKIAFTGGPCAGKTFALCKAEEYFTSLGYKVFLINETASEIIESGLAKDKFASALDFQQKIFSMQLMKENAYGEDAVSCSEEKVLIICDRGIPDNAAYLTPSDYYRLLKTNNTSNEEALLRYDAVFHLQSMAKFSPSKYYEMTNNTIRVEDFRKACEIDDMLLFAWSDHPHQFFFEAEESIENKINKLLLSIAEFLDEKPVLSQEKYVVRFSDLSEYSPRTISVDEYKINDDMRVYKTVENNIKLFKIRGKEKEAYISPKNFAEIITTGFNFMKKYTFKRISFIYNETFYFIDKYDSLENAVLTIVKNTDEPTAIPKEINIIKKMN